MTSASPATYGLLGMLSVRSWTGYELTQQVRRSLRFVWPSSEGHLYREQRRLVDLGWATVEEESAGQRSRKRYTITSAGRAALRRWLTTQPEEPHFQIEGVLRMFFADQGSAADLASAMRSTRHLARAMLDEMVGFVDEYLDDGGPLWMLEAGVGGRSSGRRQYRGRTMYPERLTSSPSPSTSPRSCWIRSTASSPRPSARLPTGRTPRTRRSHRRRERGSRRFAPERRARPTRTEPTRPCRCRLRPTCAARTRRWRRSPAVSGTRVEARDANASLRPSGVSAGSMLARSPAVPSSADAHQPGLSAVRVAHVDLLLEARRAAQVARARHERHGPSVVADRPRDAALVALLTGVVHGRPAGTGR